MKSGYIYVLVHPSYPDLYKVGQTTRLPEDRLVEHNRNYKKYAGQIVMETGQKWELKTYFAVPDPYYAETVFWSATGLADIPCRFGIEVEWMEWKVVQQGLSAAKKAGVRPQKSVPDYVYANTAWMKKRLAGRDISLVGHVRSKKAGRNNFQCINGHEWRSVPNNVAEGEGCPHCGIGQRTPKEIRQVVKPGVLCLLTHPDRQGDVKIELTYNTIEECYEENIWGDWEIHRYRNVDEPVLAELLIWELLGYPQPNDNELFNVDLHIVEQAFRDLHLRLESEIALKEKEKK